MKNSFTIFLAIIILTLFNSCSDKKTESPTTPNIVEQNSQKETFLSKKVKEIKIPIGFHEDSTQIQIYAYQCGYKQVRGWAITKYAPIDGKFLGIWASNSSPTWNDLRNKYGFSQIAVWDMPSYNTAKQIGFADDKIMVLIPNYSSAYSLINSINRVQYYHVDEPFEREMYNTTTLRAVATMIHDANPSGKMMMASYKWPTQPYNLPWTLDTYGDKYKSVLDFASNSYIMCDEYIGNIWGTPRDFWTKYRQYYGSNKNISQWINVQINNTYSGSGKSFSDLMGHANNLGMNNLWLYAYGISNPNNIYNFCNAAFYSGWLRGFAQNIILVYRCSYPNPCDCDPTLPDGWYLDEVHYEPGYFEVYP